MMDLVITISPETVQKILWSKFLSSTGSNDVVLSQAGLFCIRRLVSILRSERVSKRVLEISTNWTS